jgi:hypothetical protein
MSGGMAMESVVYFGGRRLPIPEIRGTQVQCNWLMANMEHVEQWPDDEDRIRFIFKDGSKGRWFSRRWTKLVAVDVL